MRQHSDQLVDVLKGSFTRKLTVNVFHGPDRVLTGLAFGSWSLDADLGRQIGTEGSGVIVYPSESGESLTPVGTRGVLSPFRARIELVMTVSAGDFSHSVSLGMFRVVDVPSAVDTYATVGEVRRQVASEVAVRFKSLDEDARRASFRFPESSPAGASVYGEIRRLSGMPVEATVPDATVVTEKPWEAKQGGRLEAIHQLGRLLDADLVVNSRGAWVPIPDAVGAPVGTLQVGADGTVVDIGSEISTDEVFNVVVGTFETEDRTPFYCVAEVTEGDLRPGGLYLENVAYYSSDLVKTKEQGDAAVQAVLAQSVASQQVDVVVQCHVNPLVEIGDVWAVDGWVRPLVGKVVKMSMSDSHLMNVTIRESRRLA